MHVHTLGWSQTHLCWCVFPLQATTYAFAQLEDDTEFQPSDAQFAASVGEEIQGEVNYELLCVNVASAVGASMSTSRRYAPAVCHSVVIDQRDCTYLPRVPRSDQNRQRACRERSSGGPLPHVPQRWRRLTFFPAPDQRLSVEV